MEKMRKVTTYDDTDELFSTLTGATPLFYGNTYFTIPPFVIQKLIGKIYTQVHNFYIKV